MNRKPLLLFVLAAALAATLVACSGGGGGGGAPQGQAQLTGTVTVQGASNQSK